LIFEAEPTGKSSEKKGKRGGEAGEICRMFPLAGGDSPHGQRGERESSKKKEIGVIGGAHLDPDRARRKRNKE